MKKASKKSEPREKRLSHFIEKQTDMPPVSVSDLAYIEISGQNHIELDGIRKILEYKEDRIKIRFRHNTVCFNGEKISIRNFSKKNAIIEGKINSIEFE
ncbi:MAG: hypothetical protein E7539_01300 [Ruminococcaceae bacterium]|nr:hypothetical protein [Oscillospiraceae bacterium]